MNDSLLVCSLERRSDLLRNRQRFGKWDPTLRNLIRQGWPLHQLHDQREEAVRLFETLDLCDVRVIQRREQLRLALEARQSIRSVSEGIRQDLDGDVAPQPRVAGPIVIALSVGISLTTLVVGVMLKRGDG